jgi:polyisoprenoid-binding protein YceI
MRPTLNLVCFLAAAAFPMAAAAQERPQAGSGKLLSGTLSFRGHATVGDFVGSTSTVSGAFSGDLPSLRGWVEASVATLVTGNKLRDRDMYASMEVDRYPTMRFDVTGATTLASVATRADPLRMLLHGKLTIHGVTRVVDLPVTALRMADSVHVTADFPLDLADYRIGGLTKMFGLLRMQRRIEVHVDLRFVYHLVDDPERRSVHPAGRRLGGGSPFTGWTGV